MKADDRVEGKDERDRYRFPFPIISTVFNSGLSVGVSENVHQSGNGVAFSAQCQADLKEKNSQNLSSSGMSSDHIQWPRHFRPPQHGGPLHSRAVISGSGRWSI